MKIFSLIVVSVLLSMTVHAAEGAFAICKTSATEQPGMVAMTMQSVPENPDNGKVFYVSTNKLIDENDVAFATTLGNRYYKLIVQLNDKGTAKLSQLTRESLDQRLAVLVNGKLISTPVVRMEITDGRMESAPYLSKKEAEGYAAALRKPSQE